MSKIIYTTNLVDFQEIKEYIKKLHQEKPCHFVKILTHSDVWYFIEKHCDGLSGLGIGDFISVLPDILPNEIVVDNRWLDNIILEAKGYKKIKSFKPLFWNVNGRTRIKGLSTTDNKIWDCGSSLYAK